MQFHYSGTIYMKRSMLLLNWDLMKFAKIISMLPFSNCPGMDDATNKLLKLVKQQVASRIQMLFNCITEKRQFPKCWKLTNVEILCKKKSEKIEPQKLATYFVIVICLKISQWAHIHKSYVIQSSILYYHYHKTPFARDTRWWASSSKQQMNILRNGLSRGHVPINFGYNKSI